MNRICNVCLLEKEIEEFHTNKLSLGGRLRACKECFNKKRKKIKEERPWLIIHQTIRRRCSDESHISYSKYGAKGIKCLISVEDLKKLWFRDKAYLLKKPSIDRINSSGNYEFSNCRFIELVENSRMNSFYFKKECRKGHPYSGDNLITYKTKSGLNRVCRICRNLTQKRGRERKKSNEENRQGCEVDN